MDTLVCNYCDSEVKISMVEAEEGCCPECGSTMSTAVTCDSYDDDYEESELGDDDSYDDEDDDFGDEFYEDIDEEEYEDMSDDDKYV